ncbi:MAG: DUF5680 domain-containing protein [Bacillota bacterium]|nr:DUF5680 domain-containing protein [Bacillota bacterium]
MSDIIEFLLRAKKATYAGKGPESKPYRPNSHDLEYTEGNLKYIDTYLGSSSFIGEEALWEEDIPMWGMNYSGRVLNEGFEGHFLKEALREVPFDKPFRGPKEFRRGDFLYLCDVKGDFEWFSGNEEILLNGTKVYECMFHGGKIK